MKFVILKNNLKESIDVLGRVANESMVSLPILKNILLSAEDGKISACATNLEIGITAYTPGKVIERGSITVPFFIISNIINNIQTDRINIETEGDVMIVKTDNYEAKIQGIKKEEYPIIPDIASESEKISIDANLIIDSLSSVAGSAQLSENRPELAGVLFNFSGDELKLAATDGFRLSEKKISGKQIKFSERPVIKTIIPIKTINEVVKNFKKSGEINISFDENQILFQNSDLNLISRTIGANFPEYETILPKEIETEVILKKEEIIGALKLTGSFTDKFNEIKLSFKSGEKIAEISSWNQGLGENKYLIPLKNIKGEDLEMVLNWKFLIDGLKNIVTEEVSFGFNGNDKPIVIRPVNNETFFYILMPIKGA